jgi:hypothetical protein
LSHVLGIGTNTDDGERRPVGNAMKLPKPADESALHPRTTLDHL